VDAIPLLDRSDLAKVDIEGGEWAILGDPRLAAITPEAMVLEYHPYVCPTADPGRYATDCLTSAGYEVEQTLEFAGDHGLLWAWR